MMFTRVTALALAALPALAAATPVLESRGGGGGGIPASSCSTGNLQCCNQVQDVSSGLLTSGNLSLIDLLAGLSVGRCLLARSPGSCWVSHWSSRDAMLPDQRCRRPQRGQLQGQRYLLPEQQRRECPWL